MDKFMIIYLSVLAVVIIALTLFFGIYFGLPRSSSPSPTITIAPYQTPTVTNVVNPTITNVSVTVVYASYFFVSQSSSSSNNQLTVIDTQNQSQIGSSSLGTNTNSNSDSNIIISPFQNVIYVTNSISNTISVVNVNVPSNPFVITTLDCPLTGPQNGCLSVDGLYLYIPCTSGGVVQFQTNVGSYLLIQDSTITNCYQCFVNPSNTALYVLSNQLNATNSTVTFTLSIVNIINPQIPVVIAGIAVDSNTVGTAQTYQMRAASAVMTSDGANIFVIPVSQNTTWGGPYLYQIELLDFFNVVKSNTTLVSDTTQTAITSICLSTDDAMIFAVTYSTDVYVIGTGINGTIFGQTLRTYTALTGGSIQSLAISTNGVLYTPIAGTSSATVEFLNSADLSGTPIGPTLTLASSLNPNSPCNLRLFAY